MLVLFGIGVVLAAVAGGFLLEHGNLLVLFQPAEFLIIVGSAAGIMLAANPAASVRKIIKGALSVFRRPTYTPAFYESVLKLLYELFSVGRREGMPELETHIEDPGSSTIFSTYPEVARDEGAMTFISDSIRMITTGVAKPGELAHLMDLDMEVQRRELHGPVNSLSMLADSLPGLGIVAAVLGVVVTMQALGSAPEEIGQRVAAALVGTFLGILLCYGVVGPIASHLENRNDGRSHFLQCLYSGIHTFARGASPMLSAEFARRSIPLELRPSFVDMEATFRREVKLRPVKTPGATSGAEEYAG
jgi:chemotaxis protein MotA